MWCPASWYTEYTRKKSTEWPYFPYISAIPRKNNIFESTCVNMYSLFVVGWYKKDKEGMNREGNMTYIHIRRQKESHSWIFRVLWYSRPRTTLLQMSGIFGIHVVLVRDYLFDSVEKKGSPMMFLFQLILNEEWSFVGSLLLFRKEFLNS